MSPRTRNPYRWRNFGTRQPSRVEPREARLVALVGMRSRTPVPWPLPDTGSLSAVDVEDEIVLLMVWDYLRERFGL